MSKGLAGWSALFVTVLYNRESVQLPEFIIERHGKAHPTGRKVYSARQQAASTGRTSRASLQ